MTTLYDKQGAPPAYIDDDGETIYLWHGAAVAWISDDSVYSFPGRFLGWFQDGWFWDQFGYAALFTDDAQGGPATPAHLARDAPGARHARPTRGWPQPRPAQPELIAGWSQTGGESYFDQ